MRIGGDMGDESAPIVPHAASPASTHIELCGEIVVRIGGRDVSDALPGRQGRALLAFLVLNRHRSTSRHELADALWPRNPPTSPMAGLSSVLTRLRNVIGHDAVVGRTQLTLQLDRDCEIDVETAHAAVPAAERCLAGGDAHAAIELADEALSICASPLLPEFDAPWVDVAQRELHALEPALLELRARAGLAAGGAELTGAERAARTLAERHPYRESAYALLMDAQAQLGNVAEALQTYERLRRFLAAELGTIPSPGVVALHDRLLRGGSPPVQPPATDRVRAEIPLPALGAGSGAFVGRGEALEALRSRWLEAKEGRLRLVVLVGEQGIGKTRLAARFAREVHAGSERVLYGRCDEEAIVAYQPFVEALRHALRHDDLAAAPQLQGALRTLGRLIPEARGEPDETVEDASRELDEMGRYALFEAVCAVLRHVASRCPTLLVIDDLHWADRATLDLVRHLGRDLALSRFMVIGTVRDEEVARDAPLAAALADLRRSQSLVRLRLEGFDARAAGDFVASRLSARPQPEFVHALHAQTAGNPFFMEEVLRSLQESGALAEGGPALEHALGRMGVPEGVEEVIARRLARVSGAACDALKVASVVGGRFDLPVVRDVLRQPDDAIVSALDEAVEAKLILEQPDRIDGFAFSHAILRDAVYARLTKSRRARLHQRVAEVLVPRLASGEASAAEIAHHLLLAGPLAEPGQAARYAARAGDDAASALAWEEAELHYRRALDSWQEPDDEHEAWRCDVMLALARVQARRGSSQASRQTALEAAESARTRGANEQLARAALGLGERYWEANVSDRTYGKLLASALASLDPGDSSLRARVLARLAENLHFSAGHDRGVDLSADAVAMARRLGDADALLTALMARHVALLDADHLDERLRIIDEVLALGGTRSVLAHAQQWRLYDLCESARIQAAREQHLKFVEMTDKLRQPMFSLIATAWRGVFAELDGDVDRVERLASEALELGHRAEAADARSIHNGMLFMIRRWQGRLEELVEEARALATGPLALAPWQAALALALIESGSVEEGRAAYLRLAERRFGAVARGFHWLGTTALLAESCAALGDAPGAAVLYERMRPYARQFVQMSYASCWGSVERYLGLLAATLDDADAARVHFEAALAANARAGGVLLVAATRQQYSQLLEPGRRRTRLLDEVAAVAEPRGMTALAGRS